MVAGPDERGRDVDEVTGLAAAQALLRPRSPFVDGVVVADVKVSRLLRREKLYNKLKARPGSAHQ